MYVFMYLLEAGFQYYPLIFDPVLKIAPLYKNYGLMGSYATQHAREIPMFSAAPAA